MFTLHNSRLFTHLSVGSAPDRLEHFGFGAKLKGETPTSGAVGHRFQCRIFRVFPVENRPVAVLIREGTIPLQPGAESKSPNLLLRF